MPSLLPRPPHVLLVSAPYLGHVNPLVALGRRLASNGLLVTFTTTPHAGIDKFISHHKHEGGGGGDGVLRFEHLRGGVWAPDDPRYLSHDDLARHLDDAGPAALAALIRRHADAGRPVTFVVANLFTPWALRAAAAASIPAAMLWTQSCMVLSLYYHYFHSLTKFPSRDAGPGAAVVGVPGLPPLAAGDLPALIDQVPEDHVWRQMLSSEIRGLRETASCVLVNTFDELEHTAIAALRKHLTILPVGPLSETGTDGGGGGCDNDDDVDECAAWLDAQPPRSVVFVAFGSVVMLSRGEMAGLAAGLASTGRPFLWVVREDSRGLLPDGGGVGVGKVVPWCEQRRVLSHRAVGCFVTHCGWNSTTEALAAGVPVVAYPVWSDQRTNAAFMVDVCGVGVRLPDSPTGDDLRRCVEEVMGGGLEEEAMRARAREWKAKASAAVAGGGSSSRATQDFVDAVMSIRAEKLGSICLQKHEDQAKLLEARAEALKNTMPSEDGRDVGLKT